MSEQTETSTTETSTTSTEDVTGLKSALEKERGNVGTLSAEVAELKKKLEAATATTTQTSEVGKPDTQAQGKGEPSPEYQSLLARFIKQDASKAFGDFKWNDGVKLDHIVKDITRFAKDGELDTEAFKSHLTKFREENAWARPAATGSVGDTASGKGGDTGQPAKLTRDDLQRLAREGRHDEIIKARKEGRIAV